MPADLPVGRRPAKYPPIKFGDYALWFAAQRYQHMAKVETPSEAEVAPGRAPRQAGKRAELPSRTQRDIPIGKTRTDADGHNSS